MLTRWILAILVTIATLMCFLALFYAASGTNQQGVAFLWLLALLPALGWPIIIFLIFSREKTTKTWTALLVFVSFLFVFFYEMVTTGWALLSFIEALSYSLLYLVPGLVCSYFLLKRAVSKDAAVKALIATGCFDLLLPRLFFNLVFPLYLNNFHGSPYFFYWLSQIFFFLVGGFVGKILVYQFIKKENLPSEKLNSLAWKSSLLLVSLRVFTGLTLRFIFPLNLNIHQRVLLYLKQIGFF